MKFKIYFNLIVLLVPTFLFSQKVGDPYIGAKKSIQEGVLLHDEGKFDEAIKKYQTVHPGDSLYSTAMYEISFAYFADKKFKQAAENSLKGIKLNDRLKRDFYFNYAHSIDEMGFSDSAIGLYNNILKEFPYSNKVYYEKGISYAKSKKYNLALESYLTSIQSNPLYPMPHLRIGILAAEANNPTLAILALEYYCLIETNSNSVLKVLDILENICENQYKPTLNIPSNTFKQYDELKEIDDIVNSKVAFSNKYKGKVNLNYFFIKQLQVISERLPEKTYEGDLLVKFYVDFYKKVWEGEYFASLILFGLKPLESKEVKSEVNKNSKKIDQFKSWAYDYLNEIRKNQAVFSKDSQSQASFWFDGNSNLAAIGNKSPEGLKNGKWTYFNEYGFKIAEGNFENDKKEGKWTYYNENGKLKSIQNLHLNQNDGEYFEYQSNGVLLEQVNYKANKVNGLANVFNPNGTIKTTMTFVDDSRNGPRVIFDEHGNKETEYEEKNSLGEGKYTIFYPNGKIYMEGSLVTNLLDGPTTYYHENGKIKQKGVFSKGDMEDSWIWYYEDGAILKEGKYLKGQETGDWKYYSKNKKVSYTEVYENGKNIGIAKSYDWEGKLLTEYSYSKNGKLENYKIYDDKGTVIASEKASGNKIYMKKYSSLRKPMSEGMLKDGKEEGLWKEYYLNGQLESQVNYLGGKKSGLEQFFYKNGSLKSEYFYVDGKIEGYFKSYQKNGKIRSEGYYKMDQANGPFSFYYPNGTLETYEYYIDGQITGPDLEFQPDGKKSEETVYEYGYFKNIIQYDTLGKTLLNLEFVKGNGSYKSIDLNRKLKSKSDYKNGEYEGKFTNYYSNGSVLSTKYHFNGKLEGISKSYFENGVLKIIGKYKAGEKDSIWNTYNDKGKLTKFESYKKGKLNGEYKTYYDNGQLEFDRTFLDDERHGDLYFYDPKGNLIIKYYYQFGVLLSYTYLDKNKQLVPNIPVINETGNIVSYYPNGNKSCEFTISKGYYEGDFIDYYESGGKMSQTTYKNHENNGSLLEYYPNGQKKLEENYYSDAQNGLNKYYFENGKLNKVENYLNGDKHGLSQEFDVDGKLVSSVNYVYGSPMK